MEITRLERTILYLGEILWFYGLRERERRRGRHSGSEAEGEERGERACGEERGKQTEEGGERIERDERSEGSMKARVKN